MLNELYRGGQQGAAAGKPSLGMRPQSVVVEACDFAQGIVSAAMGIAGEVIQRLEFAEDRDIDCGAEGVFQLVQGGDFIAQEQPAQGIGVKGKGSHNVIVPIKKTPFARNYNRSMRA